VVSKCQKADQEWTCLLLGAAAGSKKDFESLHRLSSGWLYGVVLRLQGDRDEAHDVLQEVYTRVWLQGGCFDPARGPARAWLTRIAQHAAIDSLRRRQARPAGATQHDADADPYEQLCSPALTPCEVLCGAHAARAVEHCLRTMPPDLREAVHGVFYDELSHRELAQRLGRPLGTVKSLLRRGYAAMQPALVAHR
jgi:RNA polymerase sigma-70 factor (ECF subfamily)